MILVADDDATVRASLRLLLRQRGYAVIEAATAAEALAGAARADVELVLQDMNFSRSTTGDEGLELLQRLRALRPALPVVLLTAWGSIPLAVAGMRAGAANFLTKPWENDALVATLETALGLAQARAAVAREASGRRDALAERGDFTALLGEDPAFVALLELVARVAPSDASVLITGESGTGKELLAEAIHANSPRRDRPFIKVNVGGLPTQLLESELFGHVRGAFTDARADRKGRFELAQGGTLFLDEIGDLEPAAQVKLLRVLQDRTFEALGSSVTRRADVRIVSATHRNLGEAIARGTFREDLYYRLNLITLHLPALRNRRGDIALLASAFLSGAARTFNRPGLVFAPDAIDWLSRQPWPGNLRQLRQAIERAALISTTEHLTAALLAAPPGDRPGGGGNGATPGAIDSATGNLDALEREAIERSLASQRGNLTRVAAELGITRQALYRRLEKHGFAGRSDLRDAGG
ncbi:MAG: sigma-54 dependent transcriptional regulator [Thermoanaerobaculia bacterium]